MTERDAVERVVNRLRYEALGRVADSPMRQTLHEAADLIEALARQATEQVSDDAPDHDGIVQVGDSFYDPSAVRDPGAATADKILADLEAFDLQPTDVARQARRLRAYINTLRTALDDVDPDSPAHV